MFRRTGNRQRIPPTTLSNTHSAYVKGKPASSARTRGTSPARRWHSSRNGSTAFQGYCELAAESSYGKSAIWGSAKIDRNDAVARGVAHKGDLNPPKGALIFWDLAASYGHVGRRDGYFWATSVNSKVGLATLPYFNSYLGWAWPNF